MSSAPVSIVLATYNRARYLRECLDSLLAQTAPASEIVLVDDGSEDDTPAVVASYGHRIRYLRQPNAGKAAAINRALTHVSGDWVWLFDDDDVAVPDAIERRLAVASEHPNAQWIYASHHLGSDGRDGRIVQGRLYEPPQPQPEEFFFETMAGCFFHLNSALVRRHCYRHIGGFDPSMLRGQDYDVQIRLARHFSPVYCASPAFVFRQHAGTRGPKALHRDSASRSDVFRRYSVALGRKIRADVLLAEFCSPTSSVLGERQALLNRLHVMANHGCVLEMFEDLAALAALAARDGGFEVRELDSIVRAACRGWAAQAMAEQQGEVLELSRRLARQGCGAAAVASVARALFRVARGYGGDVRERWRCLVLSMRLARVSKAR